SFGGMLPSHLDGPAPPAGSPNYFAEVDSIANTPTLGPDAMRIWKFHVDWANTANSTFGLNGQPNFVVPVASWNPSQCVESQVTLPLVTAFPQPRLSHPLTTPDGSRATRSIS